MARSINLYEVKDENNNILGDNLTAKEVTEKTGCQKSNIWNAMDYRALVGGKYYIEFVDTVLSWKRDKELLREWNSYRKWFLKAARRRKKDG